MKPMHQLKKYIEQMKKTIEQWKKTMELYIYIYIYIFVNINLSLSPSLLPPNSNLNGDSDESMAFGMQDGAGGRQDGDSPCGGLEGHALWPGESRFTFYKEKFLGLEILKKLIEILQLIDLIGVLDCCSP